MFRRTRLRTLGILLLLALAAAACGQKEGVHTAGSGGGGFGDGGSDDLSAAGGDGSSDDAAGSTGGGSGGGSGRGSSSGGGSGGSGGGSGGGGSDAAGGGAGEAGGGAGGGAAAGPAGAPWPKEIVIGIHAPITGAAPLPASFARAAQLYPNYINSKGGINGRTLKVVVKDDEYRPGTAVQRCKEMVEQDNAFLLIGGGGTDQIQACARYAESAGVPYLSAGVTERGMRDLRGYFAVSMSYAQQGPYLANYMKKNFGASSGNTAMVYSESPNFDDAHAAFDKAMGGVESYQLDRVPSSTQLATTAQQMCRDGMEVAYPLMAPKDWLIMLRSVTCDIQWAGVGLTMGLNTVASTGCRSSADQINGARFFSPFPGLDKATSMDPQLKEAAGGEPPDDIYVALWTATKAVGELIRRSGEGLNRVGFVQTAENTKGLQTGTNPVLSFSPDNHFGASQVHVLKADCGQEKYVTEATFAKF